MHFDLQDSTVVINCLLHTCGLWSSITCCNCPVAAVGDYRPQSLSSSYYLDSLLYLQEPLVASAAFAALSTFDPSDFKLIHLPTKVILNKQHVLYRVAKMGVWPDVS